MKISSRCVAALVVTSILASVAPAATDNAAFADSGGCFSTGGGGGSHHNSTGLILAIIGVGGIGYWVYSHNHKSSSQDSSAPASSGSSFSLNQGSAGNWDVRGVAL